MDRAAVRSMLVGLEVATVLRRLYPEQFDVRKMIFLVGNADTISALQSGAPVEQIVASWTTSLTDFDARRRKYFLYK
jgi:uncharacterized protein YbbC (DUF1343 family)